MVSNGTRKQRHAALNNETAFIRQEDAPILPPPITSAGLLVGYMKIFLPACLIIQPWVLQKSILMAIFTAFVAYIFVGQVYGLLDLQSFLPFGRTLRNKSAKFVGLLNRGQTSKWLAWRMLALHYSQNEIYLVRSLSE